MISTVIPLILSINNRLVFTDNIRDAISDDEAADFENEVVHLIETRGMTWSPPPSLLALADVG